MLKRNEKPWEFSEKITDDFVQGHVDRFYQWLDSPDAKALNERDPKAFAEIIHTNVVALDSFIDGNGRLARLLSDLVLIKAGMAPALYTGLDDYFKRGSPRSPFTYGKRDIIRNYFQAIIKDGQKALEKTASGTKN